MKLTTAVLMMALTFAAGGPAFADDDEGPPAASWIAIELNGKAVDGLTLDYTADKASGTGGCNRFSGPINIEDDAIQIGPLASTKMMCEGKSEIESQYFAALEAARSFTIDGGGLLIIKDDSGKVILKFKK